MSPALKKIVLLLVLLFIADSSFADINNAGLLDNVLDKYAASASTWAAYITGRATFLYWTLVLISMIWTFGFMALRKADIAELFAEFIRFTITTGFFWWLLLNGPNFSKDIIDSMRQMAGTASGSGPGLSPSGIVDIGFDILGQVLDKTTVWQPLDSAIGIVLALIILAILALIGLNMLLLLISGWILSYGGIFYLGFGGSRWTSDIAINYYKTVLGIAMQLFTMVLLVGIGKSIIDEYYTNMSGGVKLSEMAVLFIVSLSLLYLTNKVPPLLAGIVTGAGIGHTGMGAGAIMGAAGAAAAAAAVGGAMIAAGAAQAAGGAQAVMSAISKAQDNVASGTDILSSMSGSSSMAAEAADAGNFSSGGGGSSGGNSTSSAFAQAAGFAGEGGSAIADSKSAGSSYGGGSASRDSGTSKASSFDEGSTLSSTSTTSQGETSGNTGGGGFMSKMGRIAADAAANLAVGAADVAKEKASDMKEAAKERISQTIGGQIATAIQNRGQDSGDDANENTIGGAANSSVSDDDLAQEVKEFSEKPSNDTQKT